MDGLGHVGIPVTSLERSKAFYAQLGFRPVFEGMVNGNRVAMKEQKDVIFELYQLSDSTLVANCAGSIDHLALAVHDIDQAFADISAMGMTITEGICKIPAWENGTKYFIVRGPDGERIEFAQVL